MIFWAISFQQHSAQTIEAWSELFKFAVAAQSFRTRCFLWTNRSRWLAFLRWFRSSDWCTIPALFFCSWTPPPPTPTERTDLFLHMVTSSMPLPITGPRWGPCIWPSQPWVKQRSVTSLQHVVHEHSSDEVTQTTSQPYDYSILKSFQIESRGNNILVTQERKTFRLRTNFLSCEIKTFWFQFHLFYCCWNEAAQSTDDVQWCLLWGRQNFWINR